MAIRVADNEWLIMNATAWIILFTWLFSSFSIVDTFWQTMYNTKIFISCAYSYMTINMPLCQTTLSLMFLFFFFHNPMVRLLTIAQKFIYILPRVISLCTQNRWLKYTAYSSAIEKIVFPLHCFVSLPLNVAIMQPLSMFYLHLHAEPTHPQKVKLRLFPAHLAGNTGTPRQP